MVKTALEVRLRLKEMGHTVSLINVRFVQPFDQEMIEKLTKDHELLVTLEENLLNGGYGMKITRFVEERGYPIRVRNIAIPNLYIEHGNVEILKKEAGIDVETILQKINSYLEKKEEREWE